MHVSRFPFLLLAFTATFTFAQQAEEPMRTLLSGDHHIVHGGWGGPSAHYTRVLDQDALLVGARGGWLINHRLTIGLAGHGLVTYVGNAGYDAYLHDIGRSPRHRSRFDMGYGGLLIEPIIAYRSPIHISLPILVGAGGCVYSWDGQPETDFDPRFYSDDAQAFFVVEPGIDLELNVIPLLRVGLGASYRYTSDLDLPATSNDALHGLNVGVTVKVGRF
ncbi:MAG: hypothetical protein H6591_11950 [Flavobacteriales bacterium]|nr:hypothetical protein [Flavobacteriales bacterium]